MNLTDKPYGDYYQIIYFLVGDNKEYAYTTGNPQIDEMGNYYEITFQDIINDIEAIHNKKISHFVMLAELGLSGVVYRYNNYSDGKIYECGTTRGYA